MERMTVEHSEAGTKVLELAKMLDNKGRDIKIKYYCGAHVQNKVEYLGSARPAVVMNVTPLVLKFPEEAKHLADEAQDFLNKYFEDIERVDVEEKGYTVLFFKKTKGRYFKEEEYSSMRKVMEMYSWFVFEKLEPKQIKEIFCDITEDEARPSLKKNDNVQKTRPGNYSPRHVPVRDRWGNPSGITRW